VLSTATAIGVQDTDQVIALSGALCATPLMCVFPVLFRLRSDCAPHLPGARRAALGNGALLLAGVSLAAVGTVLNTRAFFV
jgi:hypothetical protein